MLTYVVVNFILDLFILTHPSKNNMNPESNRIELESFLNEPASVQRHAF